MTGGVPGATPWPIARPRGRGRRVRLPPAGGAAGPRARGRTAWTTLTGDGARSPRSGSRSWSRSSRRSPPCCSGRPLAWVLARSQVPRRVRVLRAVVILPLVLPPVVAGIGLLAALGRSGLVGPAPLRRSGIQLTFTTAGAVVAATFVSMPLVVIAVEAGLRSLDARYEGAAATLGARPASAAARDPAAAPAPARGRRGAGVGACARGVRRHDHVRRQPRRADADAPARGLRGPADRSGRGDRASRSCWWRSPSACWSPCAIGSFAR